MCGIVGGIAQRDLTPILIEGLRRLEYRGYDSAGVAVLDAGGQIKRIRRLGKVKGLDEAVEAEGLTGRIGIAHTRWATHGVPSEENAHPHQSGDRVALVHNGIIENHEELRHRLMENGHSFSSQTDTEVIVHAVYDRLVAGDDLLNAVRNTLGQLEGAYALGVISIDNPDRLIAARHGSPLIIGIGFGEHFIASDISALLPVTQRFIVLEEGDVAELTTDAVSIYDAKGQRVEREVRESRLSADTVEKGPYRHFMLKEIHEQPRAIADTLEGRISGSHILASALGHAADSLLNEIGAVQIVACGTSYHAGLVARYWIERFTGLPCNVEVASEYRYRVPVVLPDCLFITISQSGETADTLAALRKAKEIGYRATLAICNVSESSLVRESQLCLLTHAGPEIGVASTKAFTTQLTALLLLVGCLGKARGLREINEQELVEQLRELPGLCQEILKLDGPIQALAEEFVDKQHALFLGRGSNFPIALEGSLKLKEISYIHAEAYPAGELKHGPLALIDEEMPVVAVAPNNTLLDKLKSNLEEVRARGGRLYVFADETVSVSASGEGYTVLVMPHCPSLIAPIAYTLPLQLLAYHVAVLKGTDVDQPRNLAKSVTVE
ncbi:MAG: glutamine--fructose-6-phosphate transaminase (isomerizing) [Gammaproteobacteria bacterium]|nr:glutamine--fructose-6-phosphate transaminase (isomerizing) [Gammaproteobacteria bacterium]MBU1653776.1 glutamine--fructose-6-phosphate transaminase (isomerizing) [Gammaproteobacteria bacterium]MBU1962118.1 glutamine--fructose-6-phosphate transaminase (isomerizing) [Gammaproteobacteria bacterium]